jgi:hypothetical protein
MHTRRSRVAAATLAAAIVIPTTAISVLVSATPASAGVTGTVEEGSATWGISAYLNSATFGRPNPLPAQYAAPATFDATSRLSSWGAGTGVVAPDGSADLAFDGTSVNFAATGGGWLRLSDLEADLDPAGNGSVSAVVEYGLAPGVFPNIAYDPAQAPIRGPQRVELVELVGNTAADAAVTPTTATWTGLDGTWSADFTAFLAGDPAATPAIDPWAYAPTVTNDPVNPANGTAWNPTRTVAPFTFSVATETPEVTSAVVSAASYSSGLTVDVDGTGFRGVTNPGDGGVYVGIAPTGERPDVSDPANAALFAGASLVRANEIVDGVLDAQVVAPTEKLDPTEDYSIYTWQAHTYSNPGQDTETPIEIDWAALEQQPSATTATGPATKRYGATATITATVPGPGSVTLTGIGADQTADVTDGSATFTVPATLAVGSYQGVLTYSGGGDFLGSEATHALSVTKAASRTRLTVLKKPAGGVNGKAGRASVVVTGPAAGATPAGKVTVKLTRRGGKNRVVTGTLDGSGTATVVLPKLGKGAWTAVAAYAGNGSLVTSKQTKKFTVR